MYHLMLPRLVHPLFLTRRSNFRTVKRAIPEHWFCWPSSIHTHGPSTKRLLRVQQLVQNAVKTGKNGCDTFAVVWGTNTVTYTLTC
jgi:hypothetical protein